MKYKWGFGIEAQGGPGGVCYTVQLSIELIDRAKGNQFRMNRERMIAEGFFWIVFGCLIFFRYSEAAESLQINPI